MHLTLEATPTLIFHILTGALAIISGFGALCFKKGDTLHRASGNVFFITMLIMSASGAWIALLKPEPTSVMGGVFTFYLIATAWASVKRAEGQVGKFEYIAVIGALANVALAGGLGWKALSDPIFVERFGYPPAVYFTFCSVALIAMLGDLKLLVQHGIRGAPRIARHLWRMCLGLCIAAVSIFLGNAQVFPDHIASSSLMLIPSFLPLVFMAFWLIRVLFTNWYARPS